MNIEDQLESIVERAIRNGLREYHRDAVDLDFINRAGAKISVGWVKIPSIPRIGDRFIYHIPTRCDSSTSYRLIEAGNVTCIVTDVVFSNFNYNNVFIAKVTITEVT